MGFHTGLFFLFEPKASIVELCGSIFDKKVVKCLTLGGLRDSFPLKMTPVGRFKRFFDPIRLQEAFGIGASQTPSDLFWPSAIPRKGPGAKSVQKMFKKSVDTQAQI
jgi:hypothetical protein